jgi:hypothetical protein
MTAKRDLTVYKIIKEKNGAMVTPYEEVKIEIGSEYRSDLVLNRNYGEVRFGLHSLKSIKSCLPEIKFFKGLFDYRTYGYKLYIVKCTIPKGSRYYNGTFNALTDCLASDCIVYNEIIETFSKETDK